MVLVDTSVWIDHFRRNDRQLVELLEEGRVITHRLIIEELACGHLLHREEILELLDRLPKTPEADHAEFLGFITRHRLQGVGLGVVDVHLLASASLADARVWSRDKRLNRAADRLDIRHTVS